MNTRQKIKFIQAVLIGYMPTSTLRIFLYRIVFGYQIRRSYIGWRTVLAVDNADLIKCSIHRNNKFIGPMTLKIEEGASIGANNTFLCGWWSQKEQFKSLNYQRYLHVGAHTRISLNHYFDVAGAFVLGNKSWIAGRGSQFWTHAAGDQEHNIHNINIGAGCYIASGVLFAPGSSVGNDCIVGLGSVVTKRINSNNAIIAGQPAKVIRENYDWRTKKDLC